MNEWTPLGVVGLVPRGQYKSTELYLMNEYVAYSGISWICRKPCKGITPCIGEHWQPMGTVAEGGMIVDDEVTADSDNAVTSRGIFKAIDIIKNLIPTKIATTTQNGLMSKEDRVKLNDIDLKIDKKAESFDYNNNIFSLLDGNGNVIKSETIQGDGGDTSTIVIDTELNKKSNNAIMNSAVATALENKVEKVDGMGLSHNDFTDVYKNKINVGIPDIITVNIVIYVNSSTGNDIAGNGNSDSPYRTIERAVSEIPKDLNGHQFTIRINGTFSGGIKISGIRNGSIFIIGEGTGTTITDGVEITDITNVHFQNIYFDLSNEVCIKVTNSLGIEFTSCSMIGDGKYQSTSITSSMVYFFSCNVSNFYYGIRMYSGMVVFEGGKITALETGISVSRGRLTYSGVTINAPTQFFTGEGGRIYTGAQTSIGHY